MSIAMFPITGDATVYGMQLGSDVELGLYPVTGNATVFGMLLGASDAEITAELYRYPDLDTVVATLTLSHGRTWQDVLSDAGFGEITFQNDDPALASFTDDGDDIMVFKYRGQRALAILCERKQKVRAAASEDAGHTTTYSGRGHLALLERAVVYPSDGVGRTPVEEDRLFNWASPDFDDTGWTTAATLGTVQDAVDIAAFSYSIDPDDIETGLPHNVLRVLSAPGTSLFSAPTGSCYFREEFTIPTTGTYALYVFADDEVDFLLDGVPIVEVQGLNWLGVGTATVGLTAGTHLAAARVNNLTFIGDNPLKYGWGLFGFDSLQRTDATNLIWSAAGSTKIAAFPPEPPGMTAGQAIRIVVEENQARGCLTDLVLNFSDDYDSAGVPWPVTPNIATKTGTDLLTFIQELAATYVDVWMDPASTTLWAWNIDGRGTTKSISILTPTSPTDPATGNIVTYTETGEFQPVSDFLLKTRDGWAEREDATALSTYGRREAVLEIGAPAALEEVYRMADGQFDFFADPRTEINATIHPISSSDTPYLAFTVGDQLTTPNGVKRLLSLTMTEDQGTGRAVPTLTFQDIILGADERQFNALRKQ
jgi:hypothetical protein